MNEFKMLADSWMYCDMILNKSQSLYTKVFALIILEDLIKSKWNLLNNDQKLGIRNFLVDLLIKNVTDDTLYANNQAFINKLNLNIVLVIDHLLRLQLKNGLLPGLISLVKYVLLARQTRIFVKIISSCFQCLSIIIFILVTKLTNSGKTQ